jgi:hypothetical protein
MVQSVKIFSGAVILQRCGLMVVHIDAVSDGLEVLIIDLIEFIFAQSCSNSVFKIDR